MLRVIALSAIAASAAAVEPIAVMQCQSAYAGHTGSACESLVALNQCFINAGIIALDASDPIRQLATNFLTGQQSKTDCTHTNEDTALIRSERGEMQDTHFVSETDDVKIFRFRRQTVSLFDMSGRIGDLETENNGLPDKLAKIQTVADDAKEQAAANAAQFKEDVKATVDKAASDIKAQGTKFDTQLSTAANSNSNARSSLKDSLQASISAGVTAAKNAATSAISAQAASDSSKFSALEKALAGATAAAAANKKSLEAGGSDAMIVGWHQCEYSGDNGADRNGYVGIQCSYNKKKDDTIMMISVNSNQRQINGNSKWQIEVQSANSGSWRTCRGPANQGNGGLYTRYHGSRSVDLHRPMYVGGACYKTDNNQPIKKGKVSARWMQYYLTGDSYWSWQSSSRMIMEERMPPN